MEWIRGWGPLGWTEAGSLRFMYNFPASGRSCWSRAAANNIRPLVEIDLSKVYIAVEENTGDGTSDVPYSLVKR